MPTREGKGDIRFGSMMDRTVDARDVCKILRILRVEQTPLLLRHGYVSISTQFPSPIDVRLKNQTPFFCIRMPFKEVQGLSRHVAGVIIVYDLPTYPPTQRRGRS